MTETRRDFFGLAAGAAGAVAIPLIPFSPQPQSQSRYKEHLLYDIVRSNLKAVEAPHIACDCCACKGKETEFEKLVDLNMRLVVACPDIFQLPRMMTGPTSLVYGQSVTAKSRKVKAEYTLEFAQDLKIIHGLNAEDELSKIMVGQIAEELLREQSRMAAHIAPYIPAQMVRAVDPTSFQPKIGFITRYGVV